jgi:hypothetical protein
MKKLLLVWLCCTAVAIAADRTPYSFGFFWNIYNGASRFGYTELAEKYDLVLNGNWVLLDNIQDTAVALSKDLLIGPYASCQEMPLLGETEDEPYDLRLEDIENGWLYIWAKEHMDSVGVDVESLVVHWADTEVDITLQTGDRRIIDRLDTLLYRKTRFCYQDWRNNESDTAFFPSGYTWLANGYNADTRSAIAQAFRKYLHDMPHAAGAQ